MSIKRALSVAIVIATIFRIEGARSPFMWSPQKPQKMSWKNSYLTTRHHPGRFGDQLILYARTKLICKLYGIPMLYKPFCYSEGLALHTHDQRYTQKKAKSMKVVQLQNASDLRTAAHRRDTIYQVGFFTKVDNVGHAMYKELLTDMKQLIAPRDQLWEPIIPKGRLSVAIHIRRGGGFPLDSVAQYFFKTKFLDDSFYINGLQEVIRECPKIPLYVFIFTDDSQPHTIVETFERAFVGYDIQFDCRTHGNRHDSNVLEDFFAMTKFDCLIRSASSFSRMAEVLGNCKLVVSPSGTRKGCSPSVRLARVLDTLPIMSQLAGTLNLFMAVRSFAEPSKLSLTIDGSGSWQDTHLSQLFSKFLGSFK